MEEGSRDTIQGKLWIGYLGALIQPIGNYSIIITALKEMGCIENVIRGGGSSESTWRLNYPPTVELFSKIPRKPGANSIKTAKAAIQANAILEQRVAKLERKLDLVIKAIEPILRKSQPQ
jgi:hypothetical protein